MDVSVIQVKYEALDQIASQFGKQASVNVEMRQQVERGLQALQNGGWQGQAADAFFSEMENMVLPALVRLPAALNQAQSVTLQIKQILQAAEEEAARPFQGDAAPPLPQDTAVDSEETSANAPNLSGPPFGDYDNLGNIPSLILGPGATHQDLAAAMEQLYRINNFRDGREYGIDEPIRIVKIGPNDYLVMVAGTDADDISTGSNDWPSNASSSRNVPSRYQLYVKKMIEQNIPPGANINLVGHSQGGHVVMNLADTQSLVDQYHIDSVTSYGSSGSAPYNSRIGQENYYNFLLANDPLSGHEIVMGHIPLINPDFSGVSWQGADSSVDPTFLPEFGGHNGYHHSDILAQQPVPFSITQWTVLESTPATRIPLDNSRLAWDDMVGSSGSWQSTRGLVDLGYHVVATTGLAITQNRVNAFTQYMPPVVRTSVDRCFDAAGEILVTGPCLSDMVGFTENTAKALDSLPQWLWQ